MKLERIVTVSTLSVVTVALVFMAGCATSGKTYHKYIMRGQVLDLSGKDVYLCIGSRDGAEAGQELSVFQNIPVKSIAGPIGSTRIYFKREQIGVVRITEIVDEHYARAVIISGRADKNSTVELERGK